MGQYPHPRICRKFVIDWGAVSARHTHGSDHPPPGHTSARRRENPPARWTLPEQSGKHPAARWDFFTAKRRSAATRTSPEQSRKVLCPGGLFQIKAEKCAACRPFAEQSRKVCPPGTSSRQSAEADFRAAAAKNRPPGEKKPGFFQPLRACIRKRGLLFPKKRS